MLVFKENVKAFVYDSSNDEITKIFDRQLSAEESILIMEVIDEDSVLFDNEKSINELFTVESEADLKGSELNRVLDWKE